ncbi:MAG: FtsX-like permease family protein, partial [Actinomycetes bacterium]
MVTALLRQRRRLVLAAVAIALSVGYVAGALTLLGRVGQGLDELAAAGSDRADLVVEGQVAFESPVEQVRRLVPASVGRSVAEVPGVRSVSPRVEDVAVVLGRDGEPVVAPGLSEQPLGASWPVDISVAPYRFVGDGRPPTSADEVVLDAATARTAGFRVGDQVTVAGKAKVAPYRLVGIVSTDRGELPPGSSLALFDLAEARKIFDRPTDDNRVAVVLDPTADRAATEQAVRAVVPAGIEVVDAPTAARHRQEGLTRSFTLVRVLILGFAGLALLVGTVTVANSLTLLYADRRRTFAAFRLVGASPRQLRTAALAEAAALALAASVVGAPLGLLLGRVIEAALGALGSSVPVAGSAVAPSALLAAVGIGVVATMVAAVVPANRACRVPPIEAVVEAPTPVARSARRRAVLLALVALVGGAVVAGALVAARMAPAVAVLGGAAAAGVLAVVALVPYVLSFLVAVALRRAPVRPRPLREVGAREVEQHRSRVAATAGALLLATAVVATLTVVLSSFTASVSGQVDQLVSADLVVDSGTFTRGGLPGDLLAKIGDQPSVDAVSGWQIGRASVGTDGVRLTGIDGEVLSKVLSPEWQGGQGPSVLRDGQAVVSASLARRAGLEVGAQVPLLFTSGGTEALEVVGVYADGGVLLGDAIVDRAVLQREVPATVDIAGLVALDPDNAAARASVRAAARSYGITSVLRPEQFVASRAELLRGFERVIQWMLLFTVLQALIGVVNTLLLSIGERRRTIGLMRVAGATPGQVRRMVLVEGAVLALLGSVCGIAVGVLAGWGAVAALAGLGLGTLAVPVGALAAVALAAVVLGTAASVLPAVQAARVPPLEAVADAGGITGRVGGGLPEPVRVQVDLPVPPPLPPGLRPPPYPPSPLLPRPVVPREIARPPVPPVAAPVPPPATVPVTVPAGAPDRVPALVGATLGAPVVGAATDEPIRARMGRSAAVEPVAPAMFGEEVSRMSENQSGTPAPGSVPPFLPQVDSDQGPAPASPTATGPPTFLPPPGRVGVGAPPAPGSVPPPTGRPMFGEGAAPTHGVPVREDDPAAAAVARALFGEGPPPLPVPPPAPAPVVPPAPAQAAPPAPAAPAQVAPPAPVGPDRPLFGSGVDGALAAALFDSPA